MKKIVCVVGLGYMGLPMAAIMANSGIDVIGVDLKKDRVDQVNRGEMPFNEPGFKELLDGALKNKKLIATTEMPVADVYIVSVPTPSVDKKCDLTYVVSACRSVAEKVPAGALIVIESTIGPKTCEDVVLPIFSGKDILLSHCPERAIPGNTVHELINNDRIVGGLTETASTATKELYSKFIKGNIFVTDIRTAECVKLMENTFRDVNIALANEFSIVLEELGVNPWKAIELANRHPRVSILSPGPGVGGHCIAVDPWFLAERSENAHLIRTARKINDDRPYQVAAKVKMLAKKHGSKIAVLGVAYKKNVDDARETPALHIVEDLIKSKLDVKIHDPHVKEWDYPLEKDLQKVLDWCDVAVLVTDHDEYLSLKNCDRCFFDTRSDKTERQW